MDCLIEGHDRQPDHVALEIVVKHLTTEPEIDAADVCWGHPSGFVENALGVAGHRYDGASLRAIELGIPTLLAALRRALERGNPPDE
jgi:hypothetical protein